MDTGQAEVENLIKATALGDERAFSQLYRTYYPRLLRYALVRLNDRDAAHSVAQQVLVAIWQGADSFDGRSRPDSWIFGIAHHKTVDEQRRRDYQSVPVGPEQMSENLSAPSGGRPLRQVEHRDQLLRALQQLSPHHREVVFLAFYEDLPYQEISEILDIPTGTVKSRMHYAMNHLRRLLPRGGGGD